MTFHLQYTNPYGERFYLAELGDPWPSEPSRRLVSRTVRTPQEAMQFATVPEAVAVLVETIKEPPGWEVVGGVGASEPGNTEVTERPDERR